MLNSRSVSFNIKATEFNSLGAPDCSVLSPFLFNVYMVKFDRFLELLSVQTKSEAIAKKNNECYLMEKNSLKIKNLIEKNFSFVKVKYQNYSS